ncbi:NAD-dependent histone deacetylase SIR2 [Talaromyces islandicus]|uniref:protein acetyllysine N-acetyltransferase n=1 Tax=Talaromyces islandicus TaxID=28573 RepID=A0A0U1LYG7_TALIS|nr:NAD-dependent histone deacetylase SIR2 [Talaromyces islandicus]
MADSAPKVAARERREALAAVNKKAESLANQIRKSTHFIAFTGAGVSTSAGIPDFRGPNGNWTLRAQGKPRTKAANTLQAIPTASHMALVELQNQGILKYLVSQNCDGLHRRSGILPERISELHGNSNREACKDCGKEYIRDFRAVGNYEKGDHDHRTSRKCGCCGGALHDSIINFGESLPARAHESAHQHAETADLCLVLGSSLTVTPANEIPEIVGRKKGAQLAICNLQETPIDELCSLRIFTETDILMTKVMEKLDLPIPSFILQRRLLIKVETHDEDRHRLTATGVDSDDTPVSFLQTVKLEGTRRIARAEPFSLNIRESFEQGAPLKLELEFMGHYNEPNLELTHRYNGSEEVLYILKFNPYIGEWSIASLPAELCLLILTRLSCPRDLSYLVSVSKFWYQIFKNNEGRVKSEILRNIATPEVEADFCLAVYAQHMVDVYCPPLSGSNASIRFQLECLGFLEDALAGKQQSLVELLEDFPIDKLLRTAQLFHASVYYYAFRTLNRLNQAEGLGAPSKPVPLSYFEQQRIMRAFCRHEVYVSLLPCWMYLDETVRGLRASQSAATFMDQFKPWEIEEIGCVDQFMQDTIGEVFDRLEDYVVSMLELKQDYLLAKNNTKDFLTAEIDASYWSRQFKMGGVHTVQGSYEWCWRCHYFASKGIRNVFGMVVDPNLRMVLQSAYSNDWPPPLFGTMDPIKLPRTCIERNGKPELREETVGWSWAFGSRTPAVMVRVNKQLRSLGYVFWDGKRLLQYGSFQNPRELERFDELDFSTEQQFPRYHKAVSPALEEKMKHVKLPPTAVTEVLETLRECVRAEIDGEFDIDHFGFGLVPTG